MMRTVVLALALVPGRLGADTTVPHAALAPPPAEVSECTAREWRALKRAARRRCRGELCAPLVRDLRETVFCDGDEPDTPDNRSRCASPMMVREGPGRCERLGAARYRINVDCWGWEVRWTGGTVGDVQGTGVCD